MAFKTILLACFLISGCSFQTMNMQLGNLAVVSKQSVSAYNLQNNGWNWSKYFLTDELLKISILTDRDIVRYSFDSRQMITVFAYFCTLEDVNYPLNMGMYVQGKNISSLQRIHSGEKIEINTPKISINGKSWYSYDVLAISMFTQDRETPNSEPESGRREFYGKYDLRDAPADVCLKLTGFAGGFSSEESNVLVIKKEKIKKAFENYKP